MDRLRKLFTEAPAHDTDTDDEEVIELSEDDIEELQEERTKAAEETEAESEAARREYEAEQERSHELADRYTEAMTKLMHAQSALAQLQSERSVIGVRRFFDATAKAHHTELEASLAQYSQQLSEAQGQLRELSPLMQANNQRLDQLQERKTSLEATVESQKRELVQGRPELRAELKANLAASEALFTQIQEAERANAPLSQKLAELFQEQYTLDQQRKALAEAEETSFFRRVMPWGRSKIQQQRADLERRVKHVQREMAQTLQQVGRENTKLDEYYKQKDILDEAFFLLNQELNAAE